MPRLAALLCALAAVAAWAAPAPRLRPWVSGWDRPVDPKGGCKFERKGDRLTITVPGGGPEASGEEGRLNAPRLLRDVEGDFVVRVRVGGTFHPTGKAGLYRAGLLLSDGKALLLLWRGLLSEVVRKEDGGEETFSLPLGAFFGRDGGEADADGPPLDRPAYFRLERRGNALRAAVSGDGREWTLLRPPLRIKFPRKLKVGVFAEATAEATAAGVFRPWFDRFTLTRPTK